MTKWIRLAAAAAIAVPALAMSGAAADAGGLKIGVLSCKVHAGRGWGLTSSKSMRCRFSPSHGRRGERYKGRFNRYGLDIGRTNEAEMVWVVFALGDAYRRGALAGHYVGASAEATVGVGLGAHGLVGGFDNSFMLQPISVQGQTGFSVAGGIATLDLYRR